jgi:hypothetical protein
MSNVRYLMVKLGSIITILTGLITLIGVFISGLAGIGSLVLFNPAGFPIIAGSLLGAIVAIIWIVLAYISYSIAKGHRKKDRVLNGIIIIFLGLIILVMGGGFVIGPLLAILGGFLLFL